MKHPKKNAKKTPEPKTTEAPTGISAAAIGGAMQSEEQRVSSDVNRPETDEQVVEDDDQEWRRAGGKSD